MSYLSYPQSFLLLIPNIQCLKWLLPKRGIKGGTSAPSSANTTGQRTSNTVVFDVTKNELFRITDTYKSLQRKLKGTWKTTSNREDSSSISYELLLQARVFVIAGPREKFTETEINHLKKYLETGGSILVLLGEGGEKKFDTNINFFLEEYGIMINNDAVVRTNYHKYFHPKECLISNGVLNRTLSEMAGRTNLGR